MLVAVTLPNEKVIRRKREKIKLSKVAKIDRLSYVEGGEGGRSKFVAGPPPYKSLYNLATLRSYILVSFQQVRLLDFAIFLI